MSFGPATPSQTYGSNLLLDFFSADYATTANLNATYDNGTAGVGASLTNAGALAAFSVDGASPSSGARILVKNQTSTLENGIYVVTATGSGSVAWSLTRALDYNTISQISKGDVVGIVSGTANATTSWQQTQAVAVIGTDAIVYTQFAYSPASFLLKANNLSDVSSLATARTNLGSTASTASVLVLRDANQNAFVNNVFSKSADVVSAAGTTVLTVASAQIQNLTGSTTQTFQLPDATTLVAGATWYFNNNSTGALSVVDAGSNAICTVPAGGQVVITVLSIASANGSWNFHFLVPANASFGTASLSLATGQTVVSGGNVVVGSITDKLNASMLALSSQAIGDVLYADTTTTFTRLGVGSDGQVLTLASGVPSWSSPLNSVGVLSVITGVDGKTPAVTDLYTVPSGKTCFVVGVMVRMTTAVSVTVAGICGIRRQSDSATIINGVTMTGLDDTGECFYLVPSIGTSSANALYSVAAADVVQFNLFSAFTATTATLDFHLIGYLL